VCLVGQHLQRVSLSLSASAVWALAAHAILARRRPAPVLEVDVHAGWGIQVPQRTTPRASCLGLNSGMSFVRCVVNVGVLYDEQNQTHDDGGDLRRPRAAVKSRHSGTSQAKAARRRQRRRGVFSVDDAWSQGDALGRVQRVAGCGCVVPEQTLATDQPSVPPSRGRAYQWGDPEWEVLWRGLESLLFHVANLLQDPCAAFAATVARMSSKMQDSADPHLGLDLARSHVRRSMGSHSSGKPDAAGTAKSTSCARERQAVLDVVWGMAVMRPRIKLAQVVLRSVPRWRSFQRHRHMAKRLMPHWFPL
jgi:hypothetical protein